MFRTICALTLALATLVTAAPVHEPAPSLAARDVYNIYRGTTAYGIGHSATFGCCVMYNYTALPDGDPVMVGGQAPKFFAIARTNLLNAAAEIIVMGFVDDIHCLDVGRHPREGTVVRLAPCNGGSGQRFIVGENTIKVAGKNLCFDVPDGDDTKDLQVWTCYANNPNQVWTTRLSA